MNGSGEKKTKALWSTLQEIDDGRVVVTTGGMVGSLSSYLYCISHMTHCMRGASAWVWLATVYDKM